MSNNLLADYQQYNPGFQQMQSAKPSALSGALPLVGAGLSAAGLLSSLYGNYQAQKTAEQNYREQKRQFEIQRKLEAERVKREQEQQQFQNRYTDKGAADNDEDRRLAKYQDYYRGVGL